MIKVYTFSGVFSLCLIFGACVSPKENHSVEDSETIKSESCFIKQELVSIDDDELMFEYKDISLEIRPYDSLPYVLNLYSLEYPIDIDLTGSSVNFWNFKCNEKAVFLIEGDSYYSSIFYAYYLINEKLYYLGDMSVEQPNVEDEGVFEKDFKISQTDNQFEIVSFLNGNVYDTVTFKEMHLIEHN